MKIRSWVVCLLAVGAIRIVHAESKPSGSGYELYSWKVGNEWDYSLIPSGNASSAAVEIKTKGGPLRGSSKVKEMLVNMREGDTISWQARADSGLIYPPLPVIEELQEYAQSVGVRLAVPSQTAFRTPQP